MVALTAKSKLSSKLGFTLVEVTTVMVLIGILAVTVVAKFSTSSGIEHYNYRARLISSLRLVQQRAMQQTLNSSICHQLVIAADKYGIPNRQTCNTSLSGIDWLDDLAADVVETRHKVTFAVVGKSLPASIGFDGLGRPVNDCSGGCLVNVAENSDIIQIKIESEGFIHAL